MLDLSVFATALRESRAGRAIAIATVTGTRGSAPRHLGARMAIAGDGEQWGTVGGGRIEQVVVEAGRAAAAGAEPSVVHQHLVRDLGMCCGGSMDVVITPAQRSLEALARLAALRGPLVLVTPLDGAPFTLRSAREGDPSVHEPALVDGALLELVGLSERAILCGLGHITRALGPLLAQLGFNVIVCDDGDTAATFARPTWATQLVESFAPAEITRALGGLGPNDRLLIVTRDHAIDQRLLEELITEDRLGYLGMIGSRRKVARFRQRLETKGLLDGELGQQRWARLRSPIGLDVGAETPEEIAVAIAAELIALRRLGAPSVGDWT